MRLRLLLLVVVAALAAPASAHARGVEAVFTNCTAPCGVVQLLRAADGRSVDVLSSLHGVVGAGAGAGSVYRIGASRRPCGRPAGSFLIIVEALPVAGSDDDFRVQTVRTRKGLRRVRSVRIVEVSGDGTRSEVGCSRSFLATGVEAVFTNCTGPCGVVQLVRSPGSAEIEILSSTHALEAIGAGGAGTYVVGASRRSCSSGDANPNPFISVQLPTGTDDDFRVPTVQSTVRLRRVRSVRIYERLEDGTTAQRACAQSFVL